MLRRGSQAAFIEVPVCSNRSQHHDDDLGCHGDEWDAASSAPRFRTTVLLVYLLLLSSLVVVHHHDGGALPQLTTRSLPSSRQCKWWICQHVSSSRWSWINPRVYRAYQTNAVPHPRHGTTLGTRCCGDASSCWPTRSRHVTVTTTEVTIEKKTRKRKVIITNVY